jgi:DNA-binding NarL/FixJ family response regulator
MKAPNKNEPIKVLLVDDNLDFLKSARQCLKLHGNYEIELSSSVDEALKKMEKSEPDAIICDVKMPVKDGFQFLKMLRENDNPVPFIVFTITEDKEKALRAFRLGANGFVGKSGDPEIVFSTLQKCIDKAVNSQ